MKDQTRNLRPTKAARVAMIIWGKEYSEQRGGSMDFWDGLDEDRKRRVEMVVALFNKPKAKRKRRRTNPKATMWWEALSLRNW